MCGRLDVDSENLNRWVPQDLGIAFRTTTNRDLRPTLAVSTVALVDDALHQVDATWGIKPKWASSHLINAKSETVTERQTFVKAFARGRCVVPCSGFYEWMETKRGKVRLRFYRDDDRPMYMAAFLYAGETPQLVTLTQAAPIEWMYIHHRTPVLIPLDQVTAWLRAAPQEAQAMALESRTDGVSFSPSDG